jgi:hypothetical protein
MDSLWRSAKAHFCIEPASTLPYLVDSAEISGLLRIHAKDGFNVDRMSARLHAPDSGA